MEAKSPVSAIDQVACSISRIVDDAGHRRAELFPVVKARNIAPDDVSAAFASYLCNRFGWRAGLKHLTIPRGAVRILVNLDEDSRCDRGIINPKYTVGAVLDSEGT